ncbi:hypothetical protein ACLMJK_007354 [Lecanora helva]
MDDESTQLANNLQLQEVVELQASRAFARPDISPEEQDDVEAALNVYLEELRGQASAITDHQLNENVEQMKDQVPVPETDQPSTSAAVENDSEFDEFVEASEYQTAKAGRCVVCFEEHPNLMIAPCGHGYCETDISQLFQWSFTDEALFPPQCCQEPIPIDIARPFLSAAKAEEFEAKYLELTTVDRTYCHNVACSSFIPAFMVENDKATCVHCSSMTCASCKSAAHDGDCPHNPAHQTFMAVAQSAGYQQCYYCKRMVELSTGCFHIT